MSHWLVSSSGQLARNVKLRSWLLLGVLLSSTWWMAHAFGQHYAIEQWLFFRYARCWLITAVYCLASLSVGHRIVVAFSRPGERQDGHVTLSFSTGMLAFFLLTYLVGILRGYGTVAFFGIPAVLLLVGAPRLFRDLWAFWQRHRGTWFRPLSAGEALGAGAGAIALTLLYVPLLIPENTAYDTRWYHLGLAEHYAAAGGLVRLPEGPLFGTIPQLATVVYTWVFLLPGSELFDRVVLAGHIEFAIFLFTLGGVPALVRALVPGVRARMAWIAVFFFPSIFLYDATLTVAADHIAALWVIPAYLTFLRVWRDLRPEASALFVAQLCGLVLTKYTTLTVVAFPILAYLARAAQLAWAQIRGRGGGTWAKGALTAVGVGAVLSSPHWLKNLIWYGDPVYPILRHHLSVRPWTSDSEHLYRVYESVAWMARGSTFDKAQGAWHALYNYSLALYNWADFHGLFPIFGSLFTFGLLALPFLPRARRIWPLVVATHLGIVIWFLLFHHDRYLQSLLPWMAAAIAAMAALAWRAGLAARLGVVVLGGTQLVWGLDMIAWPIHHMTGKSSLSLVSDFFSKSYQKDFAARTRPFEDLVSIGRALP